jgi:Zn finger protein HypA/HybF involved in hydrogenase expression
VAGDTLTATSWPAGVPVSLQVHCTNCQAVIELACAGLGGTVIYQTYNEYACPVCRKHNHARTPGHILDVRQVPATA